MTGTTPARVGYAPHMREPVPLAGGGFRLGDDPASPERVEFTGVVEGRPTRAVVSGWPFDRVGP